MDKYSVISLKKFAMQKYKSSQPTKSQNTLSQSTTNKKLANFRFSNSAIKKPFSEPLFVKNYSVKCHFMKVFLKNQILQKIQRL